MMRANLKILSTFSILLLFILLFISSCGVCSHLPGLNEQINVRDSIVYNIVDSTVYHPVEVVKDVVPVYDTLKLETSLANAEAYVDTTTHTLKGKIENKKDIVYKYKYITKTEYKDSIQIKEVPVEVEKIVTKTKHPFYESILWLFSLCFLVPFIIKIIKLKYGRT